MPIYEYQCSDCNYRFDNLQKLSDPILTKCPKCEKETLKKLISAAGFQLKGTGWYATDFKTPAPAPIETKTESSPNIDKPPTLT